MNILIYISGLGYGGKERQLSEYVKSIYNKNNINVELATMNDNIHYDSVKQLITRGLKIHFLIRKNKTDISIFNKLYQICKKFSPDIIHTWDSMASVYATPIVKTTKIKFVNGMIRDAPLKMNIFHKNWIRTKITFPFSDIIVSNSYAGIKSYNAPIKKCLCIYNGFDLNRIKNINHRIEVKKKYKIYTKYVVGMVANFTDKKDYDTYFKAAENILSKRKDITFLSIGEGPTKNKYIKLINPEFKTRVKFLGKKENVEEIINIFDIGVLTTFSEGISNSIMEYMALGKPVIANYGGGTNEIVLNGITGFLINPYDKNELYVKINKVLDNRSLALKMGDAGKERISKIFNLEKMTKSYVNLYRNILNNGKI